MSTAHYDVNGNIAVIRPDNPPVNGLGLELRRGIVNGIQQAEADDAVKAVVLIGSDRAFSGGADISEFGSPKAFAEPNLNTVVNYVESSRKPVIAAISGACMGGGLELALGCHYRIAKPDAQIALPEVKLGLLPGAGGTQRLPRVIGAEHAVNMIVSGSVVPAKQFKGSALFDEIIDGELLDAAIAYATKVVSENLPLKKVRDLKAKHPNPEGFFMFTQNTVGAMAKNYPAPLKCVEAVKAAVTMPFDKGMEVEREAFVNLMQTPESRALRHAFFSERLTSKIADVPSDTPTRDIKSVGVIGGGTMGTGISINFLNAGIPVTQRFSSTSFTVVTGHEDPSSGAGTVDWDAIAHTGGTLVILMGVGRWDAIADRLLGAGLAPETPAAAVRWGTRPTQHTTRATLATRRSRRRWSTSSKASVGA